MHVKTKTSVIFKDQNFFKQLIKVEYKLFQNLNENCVCFSSSYSFFIPVTFSFL